MKKSIKYFTIITLFLAFLFCFNLNSNVVVAADDADDESGEVWTMTNFNGLAGKGSAASAEKTAKSIMGTLIQVIRIVGTGISVIMIIYVAIKYMSAAPSEKAEFKKSATAFIVGAIVLFAASNILSVIADFATANIKAS